MSRRIAALLVSGAVATAAAGCSHGDRGAAGTPIASSAVTGKGSGYLDRERLQTHLASGFRAGLYRLAVMSQPADGAVDLGQRLPTGEVSDVRCEADSARPGGSADWPWSCTVRWRAAGGGRHETRYAVHLSSHACFAASATPRHQPVPDATIGASSEHPLNTLGRDLGSC
jgi:hypothetical protein